MDTVQGLGPPMEVVKAGARALPIEASRGGSRVSNLHQGQKEF